MLTIRHFSGKLFSCSEPIKLNTDAALAQLVERRLGKAEVGGSNPLGSFSIKESLEIRVPFLCFRKDFQTNFSVFEQRKKESENNYKTELTTEKTVRYNTERSDEEKKILSN